MCRTLTPPKEVVACSRCAKPANPTDGWEHGWPLYGRIEVGFPACSMDYLRPDPYNMKIERWSAFDHPVVKRDECGWQNFVAEWGNGYKFDSSGRYRLCYECQKALLRTLGKFFDFEGFLAREVADAPPR